MNENQHNLEPFKPYVITSRIEVFTFFDNMDPREYLDELINGEYVLIEDYYYNGLQVLKALKKRLKTQYDGSSFQEQRAYREAYKKASHNLLLMVTNHELVVNKSPEIGWFEELYPDTPNFEISFPDVQGLNSSWQWYLNGLEIEVLDLEIKPYYGVYFPTRFDHIELFDKWLQQYKGRKDQAIDIGVGCGVLSFQLLQHGFSQVLGTDTNPNAIISTSKDSKRLGFADRLSVQHGDLFANCDFKADLIVFNPPWLKAQHPLEEGIDKAIYYQSDLFPRFFKQAKQHLHEDGKLVLLFSNLGDVTNTNDMHPVENELHNFDRFEKQQKWNQKVKPGSEKTKRKNFRDNENVELWVLVHKG